MRCRIKQITVQSDSWDSTATGTEIPVHELKRSKYAVEVLDDEGEAVGSCTIILHHLSGILKLAEAKGNVALQGVALGLVVRIAGLTHDASGDILGLAQGPAGHSADTFVLRTNQAPRLLGLLHELKDLGGWTFEARIRGGRHVLPGPG